MNKHLLCIGLFLLATFAVQAQKDSIVNLDTLTKVPEKKSKAIDINDYDSLKPHSPKRAMLLSALLPGAGQIYNKKYWKAPIVWVGFAAFGYFINQNNREYNRFKKAYNYNEDKDSSTISEFPTVSSSLLANERDIYRKWRDLSVILTVGWYALNIIDANVDAHLFEFNVNDVATLRWEPLFDRAYAPTKTSFAGGIKLTLDF